MALALNKENLSDTSEKAGAWFDRIRSLQIARRLALMAMVALAVAAGIAAFFWSQKPAYTALYTGLDEKANAEATDLLRTAGIPFKLDPRTGAITVPEANLHDARLKLAGSGLTNSGQIGFEMIEKDPGFGVSQFVENARYQHALETELSRTIKTLRPVREARVHLAIPKPSAFTRQREASSASVVLELRGGQSMERNQVDAIVHLVASSIPNLAPERVTVVDQSGRMLSIADPNSLAAQNAAQFDQVTRQEQAYRQRIRELLEPMTGQGRVNPEVNVDMDFSVVEEARELYNGDPPKLRSEQVSENNSGSDGPQGIPGAASNNAGTPVANPQANVAQPITQAASASTETAKSATRNYELDRTLQHTRQAAGRIRRVSVAVLVDHVPRTGSDGKRTEQALSANELSRIEALVKQAVGFDATRGDTVAVMNAPFVREQVAPEPGPSWWQDPRLQNWLRLGVGALIVLALGFGILRPALRQLLGAAPAKLEKQPPTPPVGEVSLIDDGVSATLSAPENGETSAIGNAPTPIALPSDAYEDRLRLAREAVRTDSKRVAQLVKGWVANEG